MIKGLFVLDPRWFPLVYGPPAEAQLEGLVEFVASPQSAAGIRERVELLQSVEVIFGSWGMALLDEAFLAAAPRLRAVFHGGGSVRYCTTDAFWRTEIALTTAAAINALPVAEYTLAAILFSLRRGFYYQRGAHRGGAFPLAISFSGSYGSTVGLISLGAVGRLVVERLRTFDLKVVAYDPFFPAAEAARLGVELVSLDELVARADVVSLHAPLLEETKGLLR